MVNQLSLRKRFFLYFIGMFFLSSAVTYLYFYFNSKANIYFIEFSSSVQGLKPGSFVTYKGVNVGGVESIVINEKRDVVVVSIKVKDGFMIYKDYYATCKLQIVSGLAFIDLSRDLTKDHLILGSYEIIESRMSDFEKYQYYFNDFIDSIHSLSENFKTIDSEKLNFIIDYLENVIIVMKNSKYEDKIKLFFEFFDNIFTDEKKIREDLLPKVEKFVEKGNKIANKVEGSLFQRWFLNGENKFKKRKNN